jgi:hypothetical protein
MDLKELINNIIINPPGGLGNVSDFYTAVKLTKEAIIDKLKGTISTSSKGYKMNREELTEKFSEKIETYNLITPSPLGIRYNLGFNDGLLASKDILKILLEGIPYETLKPCLTETLEKEDNKYWLNRAKEAEKSGWASPEETEEVLNKYKRKYVYDNDIFN